MLFIMTWRQVLDGTKTQARRLVHSTDYCSGIARVRPSQGYEIRQVWRGRVAGRWGEYVHASWPTKAALGRLRWEVGRTYAVQPGRGKKAVGRIRLMSIRKEQVQEISEADAIAEGFEMNTRHWIWGRTPEVKFRYLWDCINAKRGYPWDSDPLVWALNFTLV